MSTKGQPTPWEIVRAVDTLRSAGAVIVLGGRAATRVQLFSREEVAEMIGMSTVWVRQHEAEEFPGRYKLPGGDVRIPLGDIEAALERWRMVRIEVRRSMDRGPVIDFVGPEEAA